MKAQNIFLLISSLVFYGWWDWRFLFLLGFSVLLDYYFGIKIAQAQNPSLKKKLLVSAITISLGILAFFKYYNFFAESLIDAFHSVGVQGLSTPILNIVLPIGISFYTFHSISYVVDVYRNVIPPSRNLLQYSLFVVYFPQLVAGPIARASHLLPQFGKDRVITSSNVKTGLWLMLWGFYKKIAVGDLLAVQANEVFSASGQQAGYDVLIATYCFAFQIYCDFSGYTDIARGLAKIMGFELTLNFRQPYLATNPSDFWQRWHISLSSFLRDYLYIPLGGNRKGRLRTNVNLMITMLLGGLWHGASWTYVAWGFYHGAWLVVHRMMTGLGLLPRGDNTLLKLVRVFVTFHVVCFSWLIFRASSFEQVIALATDLIENFGVSDRSFAFTYKLLQALPVLIIGDFLLQRAEQKQLLERQTFLPQLAFASVLAFLLLTFGDKTSEFIYFQF